jgi:oligopeptide/dipeptide ABC transporter ATP-binding protein
MKASVDGGKEASRLLTAENVSYVFTRRRGRGPAVDGVSIWVDRGEILALVGESGSGKTTLARMMVGLLQPTSGRILAGSKDIRGLTGAGLAGFRRRTQMVFQDPSAALDPRWTIFRTVEEPLRLHRLGGPRERRGEVERLLEIVGLGWREASRFPHQLSGGQKQRVLMARVLALGPSLLVLDEPVSALDVSVRAQILNLLLDLHRRLGLTYVLISHDLGLVSRIAGRVAVMHRGRLVEEGRVREVWSQPAHPYTRALLASQLIPDPSTRPAPPTGPPAELEEPAPGSSDARRGCLYRPGCSQVSPLCRRRRPPRVYSGLDGGHWVACHWAGR